MSQVQQRLINLFQLQRFFHGRAPVKHAITLSHRTIYILPTWRGIGFVMLISLILLIAFIYNNNLAYFLAFLLLGIFFVSIMHCFNSIYGLVVKPVQAHNGFAGEHLGFCIELQNPSTTPRFGLHLKLHYEMQLSAALASHQKITLQAPALQRGIQTCDTITLFSEYPLGLFRAWSPLRFSLNALVYPTPISSQIDFPEHDTDSGDDYGHRKGQDDFYGIKKYQVGDPVRQIHWKALARGQGLYSKEYSGASSNELWLDLQQTPGSELEYRLQILSRWIVDAENIGLRYGLILPHSSISPDHGPQHYRQCLEALALV